MRYFHMYASRSKAGRKIGRIERGGQIHKDQRTKAQIFRQFYIELMGTKHDEEYNIDWDMLYPNKIDLSVLVRPITIEEVNQVIVSWPNNKVPGPNGYCGEFYKEFKDILLPNIQQVLSQAMQGNCTLYPLNNSVIVLIPKTKNSYNVKDFIPISLINGLQKIMLKILANKLQECISKLIHQSQTGFLKGRQIIEGFIYVQELMHFTKENDIPLANFKTDIHKAFDTIS